MSELKPKDYVTFFRTPYNLETHRPESHAFLHIDTDPIVSKDKWTLTVSNRNITMEVFFEYLPIILQSAAVVVGVNLVFNIMKWFN